MVDVTTGITAAPIRPPTCGDCTKLICGLCGPYFIIFVMVITTLAFLPPKAFSPEFRVDSAALEYPHINATRSSSDLTATWDVTLTATNPNMKWDIYCDRLQPALFYGLLFNYNPTGLRLASTSLRPLLLKSSNQTSVSFKLPMLSAYVPYDVAKEISDDNTTALAFRFGLMISVHCSYRAHLRNKRTPESISTHYFCNQIQVRVFSNDTDNNNNNNNNNSHINEAGSLRVTRDHQAAACGSPIWRSKHRI